MKKRIISLALASIMCISMLVGCGNEEKPAEKMESTVSKPTESSESKVIEEPKEIVEITVYMNGLDDQPALDAVVDAMNEYSSEKIGVIIKLQPFVSGEYKDKLSMGLAAKDKIDVAWISTSTGLESLVNADALLEITDLLKQYPALYEVVPELVWDSTEFNGRRYVVPNYKETGNSHGVMTPVELADTIKSKYGIDFNAIEMNDVRDIGNYEEYILACMKEGVEIACPSNIRWNYFAGSEPDFPVISNPYVLDKETKEVKIIYELPEYREYVELMNSWNEKGIWKEEMIMSDFKGDPILKSGNYALAGWTTVPDNVNQATTRYGVPVYVHDATVPVITSSSAVGSAWVISGYTENADACMKWLELINTDTEYADMFVYGIEGVHYKLADDGRIEKVADSGWTTSLWKMTNYDVVSLSTTDAVDKKEQYLAFNESAVEDILMGFRADFSKISTEVAACKAVHNEIGKMFDYGFWDTDKLDEMLKKFEASGVEVIKAELQAQVDAFLATK